MKRYAKTEDCAGMKRSEGKRVGSFRFVFEKVT